MQYLYSALVLHKSEQEITETGITKILKAAGVTADKARVKALVAALGEVDIEEALSSAVMAAPVAAGASASGGAAPAAADEAEEEEEEEEEGEALDDDDEGLGSLFG
ncbi:MAG: 50S ribosomal protein P1 [Candidatus Kariarchaeaceae archaeon]